MPTELAIGIMTLMFKITQVTSLPVNHTTLSAGTYGTGVWKRSTVNLFLEITFPARQKRFLKTGGLSLELHILLCWARSTVTVVLD